MKYHITATGKGIKSFDGEVTADSTQQAIKEVEKRIDIDLTGNDVETFLIEYHLRWQNGGYNVTTLAYHPPKTLCYDDCEHQYKRIDYPISGEVCLICGQVKQHTPIGYRYTQLSEQQCHDYLRS